MSVIDAFLSTWSDARSTYGEGTPQTGNGYDNSSALRGLHTHLESAAPGSRWTGAAATRYDAANTEHQRVIATLADLDRRLATEVDNSARSVDIGRRNLDALRTWVLDAADSAPPGKAGEQMRVVIAQKGLAQLQQIVQQSSAESNAIAGRIRLLEDEFRVLGNQKFGDKQSAGGDVLDDKAAEDTKKRAEQDVREALEEGGQDAAARVDQALDSVTPEQLSGAAPLSAEQSAYLSQMQHQMKDMSVADLKAAEDRLGERGNIVGDSWQLMANDDIDFPEAETGEVAPDDQKFENLPRSVQDAIKSPGLLYDQQMKDVAAIVKDGDPRFQTGTELDREMMRKADRMMDAPLWEKSTGQPGDGSRPQYDVVLQDIFESAGRDHQIVHDHITGTHGDDGRDFMMDVSSHEWNDDGRAAGSLFEWTANSTGPQGQIAAETANVYAEFLGSESDKLLAIDGNRQIGDMNPELVKAFSNGLMPYQEELVTDQPTVDTPFRRIDELHGSMDNAKGLFAVIDSQPDAAREWNRAAYQNAVDMQQSFAQYAKEHPDMPKGDVRIDDLESSARLLGVIDGGMSQETLSNIRNGEMNAQQAAENAKSAYEFKKDIIRSVVSYAPGGDLATNAIADTFVGPPPEASSIKFDKDGAITDVGLTSSEQSIAYQYTQAQYTVASQFVDAGNPHIEERFFDSNGRLLPPSQISAEDWSIYDSQLTASMAEYEHINSLMQKFNTTLGRVGGYQE
ncbi:EspA/EspE family type VII secretion system effector [Mycolicibacterium holsaticum]|uniref:TPR repeat region-containing protein n=1 Tax=Mycolicibacterium holsaticum TaxID=152142 RepID=UPI001C7CC06C|nr:EspA/EspE family type VII secretion system effector [Mycolicibacterium holsaticum]MDA4106593.1 hypothetical protein [Mycolicibacterium holsaticum DSM 44478 = JCM 12374]QZA13124.1 hypothetical protein K3U96_02725 [Mycolicibacterium holsaticum DSM 44478 = JCM 12374]UNC09404.1 hypothetical protein H5U41_24100 [Mycolicibacterium holsaticum DSM 44478 = JCM 12374]